MNKMNNLYQSIKQSVKTYALSTIIVGSIHLSSCSDRSGSYLPISEQIRTQQKNEKIVELDSLSKEANNTLKLAKESFNSGIEDKIYTVNEMNETLRLYNKANDLYSRIIESSKNISSKYDVSLDLNSQKLRRALDKTLNGWDLGKAEMEKSLYKQGLEVKVENPRTSIEELVIGSATFIGLWLGCGFLGITARYWSDNYCKKQV